MASVPTVSKACSRCGMVLLSAFNEATGTADTSMECLNCLGKKNCDKPGIVVEDPGESFFKAGAKVVKSEQKATPSLPKLTELTVADPYGVALNAIKQVPLPDDVKQFKKIQKVIKLIEELKNGSY